MKLSNRFPRIIHTASPDAGFPTLLRKKITPARTIAVVTVVLTVALIGYVFRFSSNAPVLDEWDIAPHFRNEVQKGYLAEWVFLRHNEHFYAVGRTLYAAVMIATDYDFRSGMVLSCLLLALSSHLFVASARRARGRADWGDLLIPALMLNWSASFNVLMGYQVVYSVFILTCAAAVWLVVAAPDTRLGDSAVSIVGLLFAGEGGPGLAVAALYWCWVVFRGWSRRDSWFWKLPVILLPALTMAAFAIWVTQGVDKPPAGSRPPLVAILSAVGEFLALGTGLWIMPTPARWFVATIGVVYAAALVRVLVPGWSRSPDKVRRAGLAAMALGIVLMGITVAALRGGGLSERYANLSAVGLVVLWIAMTAIDWLGRRYSLLGVPLALLIVGGNIRPSEDFGKVHRMYYRECQSDLKAGVPVTALAERYSGAFQFGPRLAPHMMWLAELGFPYFRNLALDPPTTVVPVDHSPLRLPPGDQPRGEPTRPRLSLPVPPGDSKWYGVRITYRLDTPYAWLQATIHATLPGGSVRSSRVYLRYFGDQSAMFYLNDRVVSIELELAAERAGLTVDRVEWLRDDRPNQ